jgi:UDP-GlcNAc:undecaprenyl-phosphate GlcNAc-1-phosphate transferase
MNYPNGIVPQHKTAVAYLGGFGVALGAFASFGLFQILTVLGRVPGDRLRQFPWALTMGSALFLLLGLYDDLVVLRPAPKFALQILAACAAMFAGVTPRLTGIAILDVALSCAWIVVVVNAVNVTDVCDGLVAGLSLLAFLFLSFLGPEHRFVDIILAGACLGFLVFNRPPARIYLGDAGSHLLGFLLAFLTLGEVSARARLSAYVAMALVAGVPLFEVTFLAAVRTRKRLPFWQGSPDHFSLRLQAAGLSRGQTDLLAWAVMVLLCAFARLLLMDPPWPQQAAAIMAPVLILSQCWRLLLRYEVHDPTRQTVSSS